MANDALAQGIANAALAAVKTPGPSTAVFLELLGKEKPSAEDLAQALCRASISWGGAFHEQLQTVLGAQLQLALTKEHVAAQRKMSTAADWLAGAAVAFSVVQSVLAYVVWRGL